MESNLRVQIKKSSSEIVPKTMPKSSQSLDQYYKIIQSVIKNQSPVIIKPPKIEKKILLVDDELFNIIASKCILESGFQLKDIDKFTE